jgi:hypothetical protein
MNMIFEHCHQSSLKFVNKLYGSIRLTLATGPGAMTKSLTPWPEQNQSILMYWLQFSGACIIALNQTIEILFRLTKIAVFRVDIFEYRYFEKEFWFRYMWRSVILNLRKLDLLYVISISPLICCTCFSLRGDEWWELVPLFTSKMVRCGYRQWRNHHHLLQNAPATTVDKDKIKIHWREATGIPWFQMIAG